MKYYMTVTGRVSRGKVGQGKSDFLSTQNGQQIARAARIAELRELVASGRYKVEPTKLAMSILARALQRPEEE